MSEPFVGEIGLFGFNFAPRHWAICAGQLLPISQNTALFSLLGTMYGGDGKSTFALPDLQGMTPIGKGQGPGLPDAFQGETAGTETVTLIQSEMPAHGHTVNASTDVATATASTGNVTGKPQAGDPFSGLTTGNIYSTGSANTPMSPLTIGQTGGSQPHNNMQPYLTLNYCIALTGIFPQRP